MWRSLSPPALLGSNAYGLAMYVASYLSAIVICEADNDTLMLIIFRFYRNIYMVCQHFSLSSLHFYTSVCVLNIAPSENLSKMICNSDSYPF